ncbi:hypothetical protein F4781DRAFT_429932 [Annulohypoxylon bovei var. microspora]|nr:hypothetical protein F4781DRAFT_429932 [Annulohypoxylon bovei var. microspora]
MASPTDSKNEQGATTGDVDISLNEQTSHGDEQASQAPHEFHYFSRLPLELQNRLPEVKLPPPRPRDIPVALHVCYMSRKVVLQHLVPLPTQTPWQTSNTGLQHFQYAMMNDIVEIGSPKPLMDLLEILEKRTGRRFDTIKRLAYSLEIHPDPLSSIKGVRTLYDIGTHGIYVMIELDLLPIYPSNGVVRASSAEEWLFGSKITIGHVPNILRHFSEQPPVVWNNFMGFYDGEISIPYDDFSGYSDPIFILMSYIWLLHEMAAGPNHFTNMDLENNRLANPFGVLSIFVALMDRANCPICQVPILERIERRFPQLSLELVNIMFLVPQNVEEASQEDYDPTWLPPESVEIDFLVR